MPCLICSADRGVHVHVSPTASWDDGQGESAVELIMIDRAQLGTHNQTDKTDKAPRSSTPATDSVMSQDDRSVSGDTGIEKHRQVSRVAARHGDSVRTGKIKIVDVQRHKDDPAEYGRAGGRMPVDA